jgi:hypothetical protein
MTARESVRFFFFGEHMPNDLKSLLISFEDFAKLDLKKPIKLLPEGNWFRGERELKVTASRLQEMARNFAEGLPNFRVGVNLDHAEDSGKVGDIKAVAYLPDAEEGSGLYATEYDLSPKGIAAVEDDGYDGISAEVVWSLNQGATYQDPSSGTEHDNVLVGVALTPTPFFGHGGSGTALYKSERGPVERQHYTEHESSWLYYDGAQSFDEYDKWDEAQEQEARLSSTNFVFRNLFENIWEDQSIEVTAKVAKTAILGSQLLRRMAAGGEEFIQEPVVEEINTNEPDEKELEMSLLETIKSAFSKDNSEALRAQVEAGELSVEDVIAAVGNANATALLGAEALSEEPEVEVEPATEELEADPVAEELVAEKAKNEKLQAKLDAEILAKQKSKLMAEVEGFRALGIEKDEYVEKMTALEGHDSDLADWLRERFAAIDGALFEAGLLVEIGTDAEIETGGDALFVQRIQNVINEKFEGDMSHWTEAMEAVGKLHPELAQGYAIKE